MHLVRNVRESAEMWTVGWLRFHWGDAYRIEAEWRAVRRDGKGEPIVAVSAAELAELISADYRRERVPRDMP
ncbi:MAG: hypothetical protein WBF34_15915 [Streptosporangiaceae bacterium]